MAGSAPRTPKDDIGAGAQHPVQDENAPAKGGRRSELTYEQNLYQCRQPIPIIPSGGEYMFGDVFIDFRNLSQMSILHLMNELAKHEQATKNNKAAPQDIEHLENLLHRYTTAVHDHVYWSRLSNRKYFGRTLQDHELRTKFPGIYSDCEDVEMIDLEQPLKSKPGSVDSLRNFLKKVLPKSLTWSEEEFRRRRYDEYWEGRTPEDISPFVDTLTRFIVAITGGLSLVIPMLVMRLGETLAKSLTTVSVAVVLFSALTSLMFKASNVETLGATAAYAAVLVVFVGTSH